ncbi:hypothetical protein B0H63DRAFT_516215 [Podospora didyma]|uniref:Uncharacterized protein n=1 Tax=Podospora didyma TaxID=330526 RepID=A0AAE0U6R0_9PEZI|nr:hypothetical protein B0H63DRAFT_516215 [Podospora didyma]
MRRHHGAQFPAGSWRDTTLALIRNESDLQSRATQQNSVLQLTVNNEDHTKCFTGINSLNALRNLTRLELKSGWWHWDGLSRIPDGHQLESLEFCKLEFWGGFHSISGLCAHRNIFAHKTLKTLEILNHPGIAEHSEPLSVTRPSNPTSLKSLTVSSIDLCSLTPVLSFPAALEELKIDFSVETTRSLALDYMKRGTAKLVGEAFSPMYHSLTHLDFHHCYLGNFKFGKFQNLTMLRIHSTHLFSTDSL